MNFGMTILCQNTNKMQNYVTWIQIVLSLILKLKMLMKILLTILKKYLIHQIIRLIDHYPQEKNKEVIGLMKDELGGEIITEFVALRPKTYSYLMDDGNNDKKAKGAKKLCNEKNTYI